MKKPPYQVVILYLGMGRGGEIVCSLHPSTSGDGRDVQAPTGVDRGVQHGVDVVDLLSCRPDRRALAVVLLQRIFQGLVGLLGGAPEAVAEVHQGGGLDGLGVALDELQGVRVVLQVLHQLQNGRDVGGVFDARHDVVHHLVDTGVQQDERRGGARATSVQPTLDQDQHEHERDNDQHGQDGDVHNKGFSLRCSIAPLLRVVDWKLNNSTFYLKSQYAYAVAKPGKWRYTKANDKNGSRYQTSWRHQTVR